MKPFGFGKAEKLKSRKQIEALFAEGQNIFVAPVRVKFQIAPHNDSQAAVQVGVSVSKKTFKRAVDRNRLKRLLREAYRLQKQEVVTVAAQKKIQVVVFLIYTGKELTPFKTVYEAVGLCLNQLHKNMVAYENGE